MPEEVELEELRLVHEWRLYDLEASLRRDRRQLAQALALHAEALARCDGEEDQARVLLHQAFTLEQQGEYAEAVTALEQAAPLVVAEKEPRLRFDLRFHLGVQLCHLHLYKQAAALLPEVQALAVRLRDELASQRVV